jgi:endo-1,4-beta-xylanase
LHQLAGDYPIGAALPAGDADNSLFSRDNLQSVVSQHFSQLTAENIMKPSYLQPTRGNFDFDDADDLIAFAQTNGMSVHGHTLVWHQQIPNWMSNCSPDCETIMEEHITGVAGQYAGKVVSWDVVNEAFHDDGTYRDTGDNGSVWYANIGESYIEKAFNAAASADPSADLYYNDYNLEQNGAKLTATLSMVSDLLVADAPIDGIGFQMHITDSNPSIANIKDAIQKAVDTGLKVKITELDVRMNQSGSYSSMNDSLSALQQARYQEVVAAYLEIVPAGQRGGISVWGVSDADSWIPHVFGQPDWPLLFDASLNQKAALHGFAQGLLTESSDGDTGEAFDPDAAFHDTFEAMVEGEWYENIYADANVSGEFAHDEEKQNLKVNIDWQATDDKFILSRNLPATDISSGATVSIRINVPSAYVTESDNLAIQLYVQDSGYNGAYLDYLFNYSADSWATLSTVIDSSVIGSNSSVDFTDISTLGIQFIANGKPSSVSGEILIDDVKIK